MRAELQRAAALAAIAAAVALAAGGCGGAPRPLRVGVGVGCGGVNRPLQAAERAGAELPRVRRGARLRGADPTAGITRATIAGRPVELGRGCTELCEFSPLSAGSRRRRGRARV